MTQPDRRRNGLILIAIAISLLFCLRISPPPLLATNLFQSPPTSPLGLGSLAIPIKVFLRGPYNTTNSLMNDRLRVLNLLPTTEPYNALARFGHIGGEQVNAGVFAVIGRNAIVDWVLVELRSAGDATLILATRAALLQRDGDVVDMDGVSPVAFANQNPGSYYVVVGHRNHLRAMTATPVTVNTNSPLVDFTNPTFATYGNYGQALIGLAQVLWSGDANNNNQVVYSGPNNDQNAILTRVLTDPGNTTGSTNYVVNGYGVTDLNLDGKTIAAGPSNEMNVILTTVLSYPGNSNQNGNYVVIEQALAGVWAPPRAASVPLPADVPDIAAHIIQNSDFTTVMSAAAKVARWQRGDPAPAIAYALGTTGTAQQYTKSGLLAPVPLPVQQTAQVGWTAIYTETFNGATFPTPGQYYSCAFELRSNNISNYSWGRTTVNPQEGSAAAWPAAGGNLGKLLIPGTDTYPENLQTDIICRFSNLSAANLKNIMVEFSLWMDEADPGDKLFVGFNTGEMEQDPNYPNDPNKKREVFYGRNWRKTPVSDTGYPTWQRYRFFYPELAAKVNANGGKLAVMWSFTSDGNRRANARGAWLDSIKIERYLQPAAPTDPGSCEKLDPTITVPGAPGGGTVSKGLVLPPDTEDNPWDASLNPALLTRMNDAKTNWVRLEFITQPSAFVRLLDYSTIDETIDLKHYDELIDALCANRIAVLGLVSYQTLAARSWSDEGLEGSISNAYVEQFSKTLSLLLTYYGDRIDAWEVWNEPDYVKTRLTPSAFVKLLTATAPLIRSAGDTVVMGGLANVDNFADTYLKDFYTAISREVATPFDIFAIHPYPSEQYKDGNALALAPQSHWRKESPTVFKKFQNTLQGANALIRDDSGKNAWITEFGWNSARGSDADNDNRCTNLEGQWIDRSQQKLYLATGLDVLFRETAWTSDNRPWITKTFWYQYRDTGAKFPASECNAPLKWYSPSWWTSWFWELVYGPQISEKVDVPWSFGLYDGNYAPKETLCTFKNYPYWANSCYDLNRRAYMPLVRTKQTLSAARGNDVTPTGITTTTVVVEESVIAEQVVATTETSCLPADTIDLYGTCVNFTHLLYLPVVSVNQVEPEAEQ